MAKTWRVGIIGRTGRGNYGHNIDVAWKTYPGVQVVGVADDNPEGLRKAGERLGVSALYASYEKMLRDQKPEVTVIASRWVDAHREMALAAAEARSSIFMEKPIAPNLAQCDRIIDACDRVHGKTSIAHNMRVCPILDFVEARVREGLIGQVQELRGRGKEDRRAGGEDMMVLGTHVFDLMRRFAGDPQWVSARVTVEGREAKRSDVNPNGAEGLTYLAGDTIEAMYGFSGGMTGYFGSKKNPDVSGRRFGLDLYGSAGILSIRAAHSPLVYQTASPTWTGEPWKRLEIPKHIGPHNELEAYHLMIADLLEAIEKDREPQASARVARWTLEMAHGAYESHKRGARVALPLVNREHPLAS
ncbi:MAG: Gfo/Idh/MocA family oxidoreductase [Acidimicrobiia bacterium]|nr:Gfo/Idh/MocA family oxidoreductase [Acidimicrobiia bacterium]